MKTILLIMLVSAGAFAAGLTVGDGGSLARTEPQILRLRCLWQSVPLDDSIGATDTTTITNGTTVLFEDEIPRNLHAPNTFRDSDGRCYSLNVLHVDGTRVPVVCPDE